jgi:hypothetical protein
LRIEEIRGAMPTLPAPNILDTGIRAKEKEGIRRSSAQFGVR